MTPSETPRYDADKPLYSPRMPSFRIMSHVIATAGPNGDAFGASAAAAATEELLVAEWDNAAAEAAMGLGSDEVEAAVATGEGVFFPADNCNRVLMTVRQ